MSSFKEMRFGNRTYDLKHLNPFKLGVEFDGNSYTVLVRFSCHCFTEGFDAERHIDQAICECRDCLRKLENRAFSVERHQLSLQLPELFRRLGNGTVYHTQRNSFFFVRNVPVPEKGGSHEPYVVFFKAIKAAHVDGDVIIEVVTAYPKPGMTRLGSPVKFPRVICSTARNEPLKLGRPVRVKRR